MNRENEVLKFFRNLSLNWMLRPAGGTPMRGSAHPKDKSRNPGVAKNMRLNARKIEYVSPPAFAKPAPYVRLALKVARPGRARRLALSRARAAA